MALPPKKKRLKEIADRLWSAAVREDWNHKCAVCGKGKTESHHLIPRQHQATRYRLMNGIALCARHHKFDKDVSPHQNAAGWLTWLDDEHHTVCLWVFGTLNSGVHKQFLGTTNVEYYCNVIRKMRKYVSEDEFTRIVGQRFAAWLEE